MAVGLLSGTDEFDLGPMPLEHGGTKRLEHRDITMAMLMLFDIRGHGLSELDPTTLDDNIDVIIAAAQEAVPDISAYHESPDSEPLRCSGHNPEYRALKISLCYSSAHIQSFPSIVSQSGKAFICS